jgi:hypothetical protein
MYDLATLEVLNEQFEEKLKREAAETDCTCTPVSPDTVVRDSNCPVHYSGNE